ncbi:6,7-dimethyl-8-ribityllumazine synthase [Poriferisphaera corsica]|uniref:6,7-dimethyl-8-ribityllumazine synthase n=1 Tax=Poriferisphaera corsica TaxID=2528020 RepID=A0A517YPY3_9BACT|nr:6,7-dimethyl-8-ribityllumazine synthase [Poriferisphaera corsica]QDU32272.1 6,7-dimethyl-8-ribityllumazine synthase [Poriferisphaera corsica]
MAQQGPNNLEGDLLAIDARVAIVTARFNEFITDRLTEAAINTWERLGGKAENLASVHVPGAIELAVTAKKLAETGKYQAVICLGCVIRGETDHYDHVVEQTAIGVREVATQTGIPCIFGVLTCDTLEQAIDRAGTKMGNAGRNAMMTAVEMANLMEKIR